MSRNFVPQTLEVEENKERSLVPMGSDHQALDGLSEVGVLSAISDWDSEDDQVSAFSQLR